MRIVLLCIVFTQATSLNSWLLDFNLKNLADLSRNDQIVRDIYSQGLSHSFASKADSLRFFEREYRPIELNLVRNGSEIVDGKRYKRTTCFVYGEAQITVQQLHQPMGARCGEWIIAIRRFEGYVILGAGCVNYI